MPEKVFYRPVRVCIGGRRLESKPVVVDGITSTYGNWGNAINLSKKTATEPSLPVSDPQLSNSAVLLVTNIIPRDLARPAMYKS